MNLDECKSVGTDQTLYVNGDKINFDSFGVKYIPKKIKKFLAKKNITTNIFRIEAYSSLIADYFCFGFVDLC